MKLLIVLSVLLLVSTYWSQNLVPNPSFETFTSCNDTVGGMITNSIITPWVAPTKGTSDYYNQACGTGCFGFGTPCNMMSYQVPRTGDGYAGFIAGADVPFLGFDNSREYIQVQLNSPLQAGVEYDVEFYVSLAGRATGTSGIDKIGAYLSNSPIGSTNTTPLNFTPQIEASGIITDTLNWVLIQDTFLAVGGEEFITIGNFYNGSAVNSQTVGQFQGLSYYFVEDVSVREATCFEIEKILVDACGTPEGQNEMVTFRVGSQDLNVADLNVTWPSNSYGGIIQNTQTAQQVASVNSTIVGCGYLLEPVGGVLPGGSEVLLITSYSFDPTAHSFANLNDTLVVIFQNSTSTGGHFANYDSGGGTRTLTMSFSNPSGCSDVVAYERDQLVNQNGTTGGSSANRDGAYVRFTPGGIATYDNLGCQVPAGILSIDITSNVNAVCGGEEIDLTAIIEGAYESIVWSSTGGTFSSQGNLTTTMTVNSTISNSFYIYGGVVSNCNDTIYDSLLITISGSPTVTINASDNTLCTGQNVVLTASGASSYVWNGGASNANPFTVTEGGAYTVVGTSSCGTDTETITINEIAAPLPIIVPSPMYSCDSNELHEVDLIGNVCQNCSYTWSDGTTGQTYSGNDPNFSVSIENFCGTEVVNYNYTVITIDAAIVVQDSIGASPLTVLFNSVSQGTAYSWDFDNGNTSTLENPTQVYTLPGEYDVVLIVSEQGCSATAYQTIIVNGALPTEAIIPNIFTPNGDGQNEAFFIETINGIELTGTIFNRWGRKVQELNGLNASWDGGNSNSGTYYYIIQVKFIDDSIKEFTGNIQLIK
jgi:gliding motility-associated-like protein